MPPTMKQGIARPVSIRVLPERRTLDHLRDDPGESDRSGRRGSKGTGAARAAAAAQRKEADEDEPQKGMFDFINVTIHAGKASGSGARHPGADAKPSTRRDRSDESQSRRRASGRMDPPTGSYDGKGDTRAAPTGRARAADMTRPQLRAHLVEANEAESALAAKIARLEQTVTRNEERDPRTAAQARQKLDEVRAQARQVRASKSNAERVLGEKADRGKGGGKGSIFSF